MYRNAKEAMNPFSSIVSRASWFFRSHPTTPVPHPPGLYSLSQSCILHSFLITIDKNLTLAPRPRGRSLITAILILLPICQHVSDPRTVRQFVNFLEILL